MFQLVKKAQPRQNAIQLEPIQQPSQDHIELVILI